MEWRNQWAKISLCIQPEKWRAWIEPCGVPFISLCCTHFLGNTSNGGMVYPVGLKQAATVTKVPRSADITEDIWRLPSNPNIFVFVLYNSDAGVTATVKSCRIMFNGVNCLFIDLKNWATVSEVKPLALESERASGFLTEICGWRLRKFSNHFLPAFSLTCKIGF